ncbi:uncharacterized protein LOC141628782 [Silene latifolia]|uniref:uncharacterized protein LOC141628782 n=1 Tax=Silene latifolia TaxID=37657 RepID=UPI003D782BB9
MHTGDQFMLSVVYGFNEDDQRIDLWAHLKDLHDRYSGPWGICGDFKNVLHYNERIGRDVIWNEIYGFRDCVQYCGLTDIKGQVSFFTWTNKQDPVSRTFSRIDRFLINDDWWTCTLLPMPIFFLKGCLIITLVSVTEDKAVQGTLMFQLFTKLKNLKKYLKELNRNRFSDIEKSVGVAKAILDDLQLQMHQNPQDHHILAAESEAAKNYKHLSQFQHNFLCQKAKLEWSKFGDENSRFFHSHIRTR